MDYKILTSDQQLQAAVNRLSVLEQQHYSAVVLFHEAQAVDDNAMAQEQYKVLEDLERRVNYYQEQLFTKPEEQEEPEENESEQS